MISSGRIDTFTERELLPRFLADFFYEVLGYCGPEQSPDRYTISVEKLVEVDGHYADAVIGNFHPSSHEYFIALEGKGSKDPLDRPFAGRRMSAVDQAYRYAINLPCDWIVVTSMRQTRLYHKGSDQYTYQQFNTEELATDESLLKTFVFLLGSERVAPQSGRCHLDQLLSDSVAVGREMSKEFYLRYADIRQDAFERLKRDNPTISQHDVLARTQTILDRILFSAFSEDRGLLPPNTIRNAYDHTDPYNPRPIWDNFRGLFNAINTGSKRLNIPKYNGGLFRDDPILDSLAVSDEVCRYFRDLSEFDYRPAQEVAKDTEAIKSAKVIDVDILGHIFEQSITDLEVLRNELDGLVKRVGPEQHKTRRKQEGAFYTPSFITRYIIEQTLGNTIKDRLIFARRGINIENYPAVMEYLETHRVRLEAKPRDWSERQAGKWKGRKEGAYKWYEIQDSVEYWKEFEEVKIVWPDISKLPRFSMDTDRRYLGNTGYIVAGADYYLLGILSSWATWFMISKTAQPLRLRGDRWQYRLIAQFMERLPIPEASDDEKEAIGATAKLCNTLGQERYDLQEHVRVRLIAAFSQHQRGKTLGLNTKAQSWWELTFDELGESLKSSFKLKWNPLMSPRTADEWQPYLLEKRIEVERMSCELSDAEAELNDRVYRLFELSQEEIRLLQQEVEH